MKKVIEIPHEIFLEVARSSELDRVLQVLRALRVFGWLNSLIVLRKERVTSRNFLIDCAVAWETEGQSTMDYIAEDKNVILTWSQSRKTESSLKKGKNIIKSVNIKLYKKWENIVNIV